MNCPTCSCENTQTIRMVCLSGTSTGISNAVGVDNHGDLAVARIGSKSQTNLAAIYNPGPKPVESGSAISYGCGGFLALMGILAMIGSSDAIAGGFLFIGIGVAIIITGISADNKNKITVAQQLIVWQQKVKLFESGWICLKCGHTWTPNN